MLEIFGAVQHVRRARDFARTGAEAADCISVRLLDALRPVLSERLAASRYGERDDTVHLSLYATGVELVLSGGAVTEVLPAPGIEDPFDEVGVGIAPDWFGALVLGRWGAQGLAERIDDVTLGRRAGLMEALFPRLDADVVGVL